MNAEVVLGFEKSKAADTVAAYGAANMLGRILFGLLCDRQLPFKYGKDVARNRLWIYNITLIFCGVASSFVYLMGDYYVFIGYCFSFGLTISSYVCLTSVVLVDLVGLEKLTNGLGLLFFVQGVATFVGPPIAGKFIYFKIFTNNQISGQLYDITKRYDWTFAFCGICLFVSGAMLYAIPLLFKDRQYYQRDGKDVRLDDKESNPKAPMLEKQKEVAEA